MYVRLGVRDPISINDLLWRSPGKDALRDIALQPLPYDSIDLSVSVGDQFLPPKNRHRIL